MTSYTSEPHNICVAEFDFWPYQSEPLTIGDPHLLESNRRGGSSTGPKNTGLFIFLHQVTAWPPLHLFQPFPARTKYEQVDDGQASAVIVQATEGDVMRLNPLDSGCLNPTHE